MKCPYSDIICEYLVLEFNCRSCPRYDNKIRETGALPDIQLPKSRTGKIVLFAFFMLVGIGGVVLSWRVQDPVGIVIAGLVFMFAGFKVIDLIFDKYI